MWQWRNNPKDVAAPAPVTNGLCRERERPDIRARKQSSIGTWSTVLSLPMAMDENVTSELSASGRLDTMDRGIEKSPMPRT